MTIEATPTPFSLLPTPTTFTSSSECPTGSFATTALDPQWSAVCRHCLPAEPTGTAAFGLPDLHIPNFSTLAYATWTPQGYVTSTPNLQPTWTATFTNTPGPTPTPAPWSVTYNFLSTDGNWNKASGASNAGVNWLAGQGWRSGPPFWDGGGNISALGIEFYFPETVTITGFEVDYHVDFGSFQVGNGHVYLINSAGTTLRDDAIPGVWTQTFVRSNLGVSPVKRIMVTMGGYPSGGTNQLRVSRVKITGVGGVASTPTPVPTWTPLPSATPPETSTPGPGASNPTPTPHRGVISGIFGGLADCRTPVYATEAPAVGFDLGYAGAACYRLFPGIHVGGGIWDVVLPGLSIDVPIVDFCFHFYQPTLSILGITVDLVNIISAAFAFFIVRWALFN